MTEKLTEKIIMKIIIKIACFLSIITIPAIICKKTNSKLFGTMNPRAKIAITCAKRPNLGSKKVLRIKMVK